MNDSVELLAVDFGDRRTGLARANTQVQIPEPLPLLTVTGTPLASAIAAVAKQQAAHKIIIGLPKSLSSKNDTSQTAKSRDLANQLAKLTETEVILVDETLSTVGADKWRTRYPDAAEDSLAACVILERYMEGQVSDK